MRLSASHTFLPKSITANASLIMDHFGIGFETAPHLIAENFDFPLEPGQIVLFTGPSGSGKSTLMKAAASQLQTPKAACGFATPSDDLPTHPAPSNLVEPLPTSSHSAFSPPLPSSFLNIDALTLPNALLIDALNLPLPEALDLLTACGLGEPRLLLRTPHELSDGQRYRFRLALALSHKPGWILADEFTATLDRTLAKVIAFNIHRLCERTQTGFLLATTHEDVLEDLQPHHHIRCRLDDSPLLHSQPAACGLTNSPLPPKGGEGQGVRGVPIDPQPQESEPQARTNPQSPQPQESEAQARTNPRSPQSQEPEAQARANPQSPPIPGARSASKGEPPIPPIPGARSASKDETPFPRAKKKRLTLLPQLEVTTGTKRDWTHFARFHYRSHNLGIVRFVTLLWHGEDPIGICVFTSAPLALRQRNRFFGISPKRTRTHLRVLDRQIVHLSRVVLHPTWRGAGVATLFVRKSCEACPWPWIETLTEMGHLNPFFERAGFLRVGTSRKRNSSRHGHSAIYGAPNRHGKKPAVTQETFQKSRHANPIYYIRDNRADHPAPNPT